MVDKEKILGFLQKHKFDLMREVPGFVNAVIADTEDKLLLRVFAPLANPLNLMFEDEQIPVEVIVDFPDAKPTDKIVVLTNSKKPLVVTAQPENIAAVVPEEVAIGPHEQGGRDSKAFEDWKQRHKHIKLG